MMWTDSTRSVQCDGCGRKVVQLQSSAEAVLESLRDDGWYMQPSVHICPTCLKIAGGVLKAMAEASMMTLKNKEEMPF